MASDRDSLLRKFETLDRHELWGRMATLATNAAVIVVIAFVIAYICVGGQ